jgi:DNA polymerase III alpha subunit
MPTTSPSPNASPTPSSEPLNRPSMLANLDWVLKHLAKQRDKGGDKQGSLFSSDDTPSISYVRLPDWGLATKLWYERKALGTFVSSHPVELCRPKWEGKTTHGCGDHGGICDAEGRIVVAGLIEKFVVRPKVFFLELTDLTGRIEVMGFNDDLEKIRHVIALDSVVAVKIEPYYRDFTPSFRVKDAHRLLDYASLVSEK